MDSNEKSLTRHGVALDQSIDDSIIRYYYGGIPQNKSVVDKYGKELVNANFGDLFIQSYLMLHQSGFNTSNRIRFSLIGRYINIDEKSFKGCKKSMELLDLY